MSCSLPVSFNTWINKSNIILVVEVLSDILGDLNESLKGKSVIDVGIQVVFIVLEFIHLLDGIIVISDLWEGE